MIWSMKVPPKVKNLMWRACRNAVPTKTALLRRTITVSQLCDQCHVAQEDPLHALKACSKLDVVWSDVELWNFRNSVGFMDFKELLLWFIAEDKNVDLFAVTDWSVWNQWNKVQLNQLVTALHQVASVSKYWWQEFRAQQVELVEIVRQGVRAEEKCWRPPSVELVKINFDGAVFANENKSGIGVVIRNDEGLVLASCVKKIPVAYSG